MVRVESVCCLHTDKMSSKCHKINNIRGGQGLFIILYVLRMTSIILNTQNYVREHFTKINISTKCFWKRQRFLFFCIHSFPLGLEDVSKYPTLIQELLQRNWSETELSGVLRLNFLRVFEEVERVS